MLGSVALGTVPDSSINRLIFLISVLSFKKFFWSSSIYTVIVNWIEFKYHTESESVFMRYANRYIVKNYTIGLLTVLSCILVLNFFDCYTSTNLILLFTTIYSNFIEYECFTELKSIF